MFERHHESSRVDPRTRNLQVGDQYKATLWKTKEEMNDVRGQGLYRLAGRIDVSDQNYPPVELVGRMMSRKDPTEWADQT